ncbi:MAG: hypothetical protein HGB10_03190 [Coriobacteriia bacterium]|nr:hypothetical protein [Coriobacteriia bacterium]
MRRFVAVLVVAVLALTLFGCGGGGEAAAPAAPAATGAEAAPVAPPASPPVALSENEPEVFEPFPTSDAIPKEVSEAIAAKQPTLIYFYDATQSSSKESRKIINSVLNSNRGLVDLAAYDVGEYIKAQADGTVNIDNEPFSKDADYQQSIELARLLGVKNTPYVVITDSQGYIIWKFKGLVERDFLEREVLRAAN